MHQLTRFGADETDACAGQVGELRAGSALERFLIALARLGFAPIEHQGGFAYFADAGLGRIADIEHAADGGIDLLELGNLPELGPRLLRYDDRVLQRRTRRQFDAEIAVAEIGERNESRRNEGHDRQ